MSTETFIVVFFMALGVAAPAYLFALIIIWYAPHTVRLVWRVTKYLVRRVPVRIRASRSFPFVHITTVPVYNNNLPVSL